MKPQPGAGFDWIDTDSGPALVCRPLERAARHFFTTRQWSLGTAAAVALDNGQAAPWADVANALGVAPSSLARVHQVHGATVEVRRAGSSRDAPRADADIIVSDDPALALAIQTADCVPILIADATRPSVAAVHAGWRGLAARAPEKAVAALTKEVGSQPADLIAAIGPAIGAARYEVDDQVRARFTAAGFGGDRLGEWFPVETRPGHWLFDGARSARDQLAAAGVRADRIHSADLCTASWPDLFCSYRRDGKAAGRMAAAIRTNR